MHLKRPSEHSMNEEYAKRLVKTLERHGNTSLFSIYCQ
jgi:hypothetical protein